MIIGNWSNKRYVKGEREDQCCCVSGLIVIGLDALNCINSNLSNMKNGLVKKKKKLKGREEIMK